MTPLGLRERLEELGRHPAFRELLAAWRSREPTLQRLSGLASTARAAYALLLQRKTGRPLLALTGSQASAEAFHEELQAWSELMAGSATDPAPCLLPAHDVTPCDGLSPHPDICETRGIVLWRMAEKQVSIIVAPIASALQRVASAGAYRDLAWQVEAGDEIDLADLERGLGSLGYSRREPVEMVGQFAVRGGIVDVFVPESERPVRLELFGDQVESIREFDPGTQRSIRRRDTVTMLPMHEYPAGGSGEGLLPPGWEFTTVSPEWRSHTLLDLLPDAMVLWHEPREIEQEAAALWERLEEACARTHGSPGVHYAPLEHWVRAARARRQVALDELGLDSRYLGSPDGSWRIPSQSLAHVPGGVVHVVQEIKSQIGGGSWVLVAAASTGDLERLADMFREYEVPFQIVLRERSSGLSRYLEERAFVAGPAASAILVRANIARGCMLLDAHFAVYGTQDIFAASELVPSRESAALPAPRSCPTWRICGKATLSCMRSTASAAIWVLARSKLAAAAKTSCCSSMPRGRGSTCRWRAWIWCICTTEPGAPQPPLDRMGGQTWEKTKKRVKARLLDMADELLKLYAQRKLGRDFAYSPDSNWQREFEDSFAHAATDDQLTAAKDIKRDMESSRIMDRLVCGDVGFGKTEVAMRAAFKALGDDKQVAVLVPTTVLAYQHLETFRQRFAAFPVEIEMLSRFRTAAEQRGIVARLREGRIDIVIGTHRLLAKDVEFQDLGLLIVDEEQRFGVRHKERLKQVRKTVDVLSLTATPIPRTLYMSLMGLRDVSVIKTPPQDRLAVQTVVAEYDDHMVHTAIRREVARSGQVYFLHNRVGSIREVAGRLAAALPEVRFEVGHGQMGERDLERVMLGFMRHEFDVLVATTIVENGLDIALANTMIVDRADLYGLAELYQLRGRVGRSNRRAYAYLLVAPGREITETARKRLAALREFSELGSGFKIAAQDLELRGAGNLLGASRAARSPLWGSRHTPS